MSRPPEDQPSIWLKQVPLNRRGDEGVWRQHLLENHTPVARSRERPRADVDAVTLQDLRVAATNVLRKHGDQFDPEFKALHDAILGMDDRARQEWRDR